MKIVALRKRAGQGKLMLLRKSKQKQRILKSFQCSVTNAVKENIYTWKKASKTK